MPLIAVQTHGAPSNSVFRDILFIGGVAPISVLLRIGGRPLETCLGERRKKESVRLPTVFLSLAILIGLSIVVLTSGTRVILSDSHLASIA